MGTSLGYGQGMEYQYFDVPQPSQPMPKLRMERLQQLRQERMRRNNQHGPDLTALIRKKREGNNPPIGALHPPDQVSPSPMQRSPVTPPPAMEGAGQVALSGADFAVAATAAPAAEPAQNTAAIQKVRVGRAALILSGAFIASRVLGLLRQSMFSGVFGAFAVSDAYVQAFLVPDTIFQIVSGGALASAFIPIFTKYMVTEDDEDSAWHIANTALTLCTAVMVVVAVIAMIFAVPISRAFNPTWSPDKQDLTAGLMRVMLLQSVILGSGVIINSVLQARQNFMLPAIGTVVYNVGLIVGLVPGMFLGGKGASIYWAAWGVVIGALLQVIVQVTGLKKVGMHYRLSFDWRNTAVLQIMKQMVPRVFNASMLSLTTFVDRFMIGLLGAGLVGAAANGLVTQYFNAYQLVMLPLGIIGMAMSTAAFPTLAEYVSRGRMERVQTIMLETLRSILFLSIPSSLGLIILGLPIIQALLQHGAFTLDAANATAVSLGFYGIGLVGMAAVEICTRGFYALRDSRTPVIVSISQFVVKIALGLILVNIFFSIGTSLAKGGKPEDVALNGAIWGMGSLALATGVSSIGEAVVLFTLLHYRIGGLFQRSLLNFLMRVAIATGAMGIALLAVRLVLDAIINTTNPSAPHYVALGALAVIFRLLKVAIEMFVGLIVYLRASKMLKLEELGPFRRMLDRFKLSWLM